MAPLGSNESVSLAVVGGGISGLAAAHRAVEIARERGRTPSVVLFEADDRLGGQIRTERHGELVLEGGPDALVAQKPAGVALCERIGLSAELRALAAQHAATQIYSRGKLHRVPEGFLMMAPTRLGPVVRSSLFSWRGKLRMALEPWVAKRSASVDDESLSSFVTRRFGAEVLERVSEPVMAGLFTADADRLSVRMTMPRFLDLEAAHGSVTRGLHRALASSERTRPFGHGTGASGFVAVASGLSRIVEAIAVRLPAGTARTGARVVTATHATESGEWALGLSSGATIRADAVLFACPAGAAATALRSLDPRLSEALLGLRYASCATVNIAYARRDVGARLEGFGFFVPRTESLPILACSYVTEKFEGRAPPDTAVFRTFIGGATRPRALDAADDAMIRDTHETLKRILDIKGEPLFARAHRSRDAMPQFDVGARESIDAIQERARAHRGLYLAGSVAGAFGLPDCIRSGEDAAAAAIAPGSSAWVAYHANQNA